MAASPGLEATHYGAAEIEDILSRLLVPNQDVIQQATQELKTAVKNPAILAHLGTILAQSKDPQTRQYAAILLRMRVAKARQWRKVPEEVAQGLRENILPMLLRETESSVRRSIVQVIAVVARHDIPKDKWPQFFSFVELSVRSENAADRETGMYVLSVAAGEATSQLAPHLNSILSLCSQALDDQSSVMVQFYAIKTLTNMVIMVGTEHAKPFQSIVPKVMGVINKLTATDEEKAIEALDIFDELVESEVTVIVPHIKSVIEFCLQIGANQKLSNELRAKALTFVTWLTKLKRKTIVKLKLTEAILAVLFPIMCEPLSQDEEDEEFEEAEASTPSSVAAQVIDNMSQNIPPEKFMPNLFQLVEPALQHTDPNHRRAALLALAVSAEGCAEYLMTKHLKNILEVVCKAVQDPSSQVRHAALFTLGQFSEHLQPEISKYCEELLPLLFTQMDKISNEPNPDPKAISKSYYALEMFCENLGKEIIPYLPPLMEHLLTTIEKSANARGKELAISAVAATASAAKEEIVPYFAQIIEHLKGFLTMSETEDHLKVQMQALDTLGVLARTMGEHFRPLAAECLMLGLTLIKDATDPDLKRCIYGLFAATSTLLKAELAPHLEDMVGPMIQSIKSSEGITAHLEEEFSMFKVFETDDVDENAGGDSEIGKMNGQNDEEDEEEEEEIQGYSVINAYFNEKEDACVTLGELSENTGALFLPYMETSFQEILAIVDHPCDELRKGCITALSQLCCSMATITVETNSQEVVTALQAMLSSTVPMFIQTVREDHNREVAMVALDCMKDLLEKIPSELFFKSVENNTPDSLVACVKDVLQQKVACQDQSEDGDGDDEQAEFDGMLEEAAGDVIPALARATGGQVFSQYLLFLVPLLLQKVKKTSPTSDKSFGLGILAETVQAVGEVAASFSSQLLPVFIMHIQDKDEEVRSNAVFAVGVLAANCGQKLVPNYTEILQYLVAILSNEKDRNVIDNICGALCRLIWTNPEAVPIEQVFPVVLQCLPLVEDQEENATVYPCIGKLYQMGNPVVLNHTPQLLHIFSQVIGSEHLTEELQTLLVQMIQSMKQQNEELFQKTVESLPQEQAAKLLACVTQTT